MAASYIKRYIKTNEHLMIGYKSCGWTLVEMYPYFNVWERIATYHNGITNQTAKIRECFGKHEIPNQNSNPRFYEG